MSQMNQVNGICLPMLVIWVKQQSPSLSAMQIWKSTGCLFFNCLQLTKIRESNSNYTFISYHKLTKQSLKLKTALHFI